MSEPLPSLNAPGTPQIVRDEMAALKSRLDETIPPKRDAIRNLLIATWNIKDFGSLYDKNDAWTATGNAKPKRDRRALWAIIEILSRFDVIAVQEVTGDLKALRTLIKTLGENWGFVMTDVVKGDDGGAERLAFVYDRTRVELSGLAGELVVPQEWLDEIGAGALRKQFARTPYAVSFRAGTETFILVTLHVDYGESAADRLPELKAIARWMKEWAGQSSRWHHNLIALGDFNIDRKGDDLWQAFVGTGLEVPVQLDQVPRSIFGKAGEAQLEKYYDQIAWFMKGTRKLLNLELRAAGTFDFVGMLYTDIGIAKQSLQYRMSDHYPLWVEFDFMP
jgi:endonuclease/exonuclease/phosphatase family metal-dependent hydrolase